ncbi:MAG TPA: ABC transporter substrate-binding protein [Candidatus Lustribacter sp.]
MRRPARAIAAIVAALLLAAAVPRAAIAAEPYEIDAVLPVTGGAAFLGKQEAEAIRLFEASLNKAGGIRGRAIHVNVADDQTNPQVAVQLMTQALARHPAIVLDGGPATTCRATAALIANGPLQYCLTPSIHPAPGSYQFSAMYSSDDILGVSMRYLRERGLKKIAVLNGTDASGQDADQILAALIKTPEYQNAGVSFVAYEHYNLSDLSVVAQLTRIKAAGAQAFIAFTTGTAIATVLHGMQDLGLDIPCVTSPGNMSYAQMESYKAFMPKELLFAGPPALVPEQLTDRGVKKAVADFTATFKAAGGGRPDLLAAVAWDPMGLLAAALQKRGLDATPAQLREELAGVRDWAGTLGRYNFVAVPQRGVSQNWVIMERWDPAKDAWVAISKPGGSIGK